MYKFYVIRDDHAYDFHYMNRGERGAGMDALAFSFNQPKIDLGATFERGMNVYGSNTEPDANALASMLAEKYPGNKYIVVKADVVYQAEVTAVKAAKMSEKGLLPV